jgi:hypothetical protein
MRQVFGSYNDCFPEDSFRQTDLATAFDMLIYVDQVTPEAMLFQIPSTANPHCARAPQNLDFTAGLGGWFRAGPAAGLYTIGLDPARSEGERQAAYLRPLRLPSYGPASLMQEFRADDYRGKRVRLSAALQASATRDEATLWLQIDGPGNQQLGRATRPIHNGTQWQSQAIELDVPATATRISLGIAMASGGKLWIRDLRFGALTAAP